MPSFNVLANSRRAFDPIGGQLEGMVSHRGISRSRATMLPNKRPRYDPTLYKTRSAPSSQMVRSGTRTVSRRRFKRRVRSCYRRPRRSVPMMWPRTKLVKFRVVSTGSSTAVAGGATPAVVVLKANSLNDPTGTISSNLPLGLDQWAAMYKKYAIVGSQCFIRIHAQALTGAIAVGISCNNESSGLASHQYYMESPRTRSKMLTSDIDHCALGINYSTKKHWKVRKIMDAEEKQATFSTSPGDPTDLTYYHLWFQDVNTTDGATCEYIVTIEFIALLFDPIIPSRSSL